MPGQVPLILMVQYNLIQEAWNIGGLVSWIEQFSVIENTNNWHHFLSCAFSLCSFIRMFILESFGKHGACTGLNKMLTWKDL